MSPAALALLLLGQTPGWSYVDIEASPKRPAATPPAISRPVGEPLKEPFARRILPASWRSEPDTGNAAPASTVLGSHRYADPDDDRTPGTGTGTGTVEPDVSAPPPPSVDDLDAVLSPSKHLAKSVVKLAQRDGGNGTASGGGGNASGLGGTETPSVPSKTTASPQTGTTGQAPTATGSATAATAPATYGYTRPAMTYAAPAPTYTYGVGYGGGSVVGYTYPASYGYTTYATPTYPYGAGSGNCYMTADGRMICDPNGAGYGSAYGSTGFAVARPGLFGRLFGRR